MRTPHLIREVFLEFAMVDTADLVTAASYIRGNGGLAYNLYGGYTRVKAGVGGWYTLAANAQSNVTINNGDSMIVYFTAFNSKESFRVTVSMNNSGSGNVDAPSTGRITGATTITWPRQVTLFVERLVANN